MRIFNKHITPDTLLQSIIYKMDISQRSKMAVSIEENRISLEVGKYLTSKDSDGYVYQVNVKNRVQQSNKEVRKMEEDLSALQSELIVRTDDEGRPTHIINQYAIREKWEEHKIDFYKKFKDQKNIENVIEDIDVLLSDEKAFLRTIKQSEVGTLLFPVLYKDGLKEGDTFLETREYEDFFGETSLPLLLKTTFKKRDRENRTSHFYRGGELDQDRFDHQALRRNFRKLLDNYKLAANVKLDYMETYKLNKEHWITHGGQLFRVDIKELFHFEQVVRFAPLKIDYGR